MVYGTHHVHRTRTDGLAGNTFQDLDLTVREAKTVLAPHLDEFDAIIVTGVSGIVVGAPVALATDKQLLVLRKETDNCHGYRGELIGKRLLDETTRVLFLDDLVSTGETLRRCEAALADKGCKIVAHYLYDVNGRYLNVAP